MKIKALCFIVAILATHANADFSGKVISVQDGGRVNVDTGQKIVTVNMLSLVTPFPNQNLYAQSRIIFEDIFVGRNVNVKTKNTLNERCIYGEIYSDTGINLNEALLMTGFAWIFNEHVAPQRYLDIENLNKEMEKGLWLEEYYFQFGGIPLDAMDLEQTCIAIGISPVDESEQRSFKAEKELFGFSLWLKTMLIGVGVGFGLWFFIFWFDNLGLDLFKPFRKKTKKDN